VEWLGAFRCEVTVSEVTISEVTVTVTANRPPGQCSTIATAIKGRDVMKYTGNLQAIN